MAVVVVLGVQCAKALGSIDVTSHSRISLVVRVVVDNPKPGGGFWATWASVELMRNGVEPSVDSYQTSTCMHTRVPVSVRVAINHSIGRRSWCATRQGREHLRSKSASDLRSAHLKGYDQTREAAGFATRGRPLDCLLPPHHIVAPHPRRADSLGGRKWLKPSVATFRAWERPAPRRWWTGGGQSVCDGECCTRTPGVMCAPADDRSGV